MKKERTNDLVFIIGIICALIAISKIIPTWVFVILAIICGIYLYLKNVNKNDD